MSKKTSPKKSVAHIDELFLEALQDELGDELIAEEVLAAPPLEQLPPLIAEAEPESGGRPEPEPAAVETVAAPEASEAGLKVLVAADGMTASLLARNCPPLELETLKESLRGRGVVYGLDESMLVNAVTSIRTGGGWQGELVVARGCKPSLDDLITYPLLSRVKDPVSGKFVWRLGETPLFFEELRKLLAARTLDEINSSVLLAKAVNPYEVIATLKGKETSRQGYNVYGQPVGDQVSVPEAGPNVRFDEGDGSYAAKIFGYLVIDNKAISVLPPTWVPKDQMTMYFVNLKQAGPCRFPSPDHVRDMLKDVGVEWFAYMFANIEKMCACFAAGKELPRTLKIACGLKPVAGRDASFEFYHDTGIRAGTVREGDAADSMDMRERNLVTSVKKDTLLGRKVKATKGKPGKSIYGNKVKPVGGKDRVISYNQGVYEQKKEDDILEYYAKIDGNVGYSRDHVTVSDVFDIEGDVDYGTGNIQVKTGLSVGGSVRPGFSVKAGGNTIIKGTVEQGATVFVQGDLSVEMGIMGQGTKVVVIGNLQVDFIQDAEVAVKGDITVKSYIYNGTVRAGGTIRVLRQLASKGGKIIGGFSCASKGIEVSTVGSPTMRNTVVSLQADPIIYAKRQKLNDDLAYCDENIAKMLRTLQLKAINAEAIKAILAQAPPEQKEMLVKILNGLQKFVKHREEVREKKKQLELHIEHGLQRAKIRVSAEFFEGNEVEIGDKRFVAQDDMGPSIFQLREDRIVC